MPASSYWVRISGDKTSLTSSYWCKGVFASKSTNPAMKGERAEKFKMTHSISLVFHEGCTLTSPGAVGTAVLICSYLREDTLLQE